MEDAVSTSTAGRGGRIVVAGAGYAGLHVALRLTAKLRSKTREVTHFSNFPARVREKPEATRITRVLSVRRA
jgi:nucleoside-diphosphate-sugar epimerase